MYRIFIVEDDEIIANLLKKNLCSWGYDVSCAEDFSNIIQEFAHRDPQLVLLDLKLPFYNGFHWCEEIRRISQVPIIFISSASDNMNMVMAMSRGADDFIAKPFDLDVLTAKIQAILRRTYSFGTPGNVLEHKGAVLNPSRCTLDSIIREQIHKYAGIFISKKLSLTYEGISENVLTDEKWLGFVIGQILSNALKYTRTGGIRISLKDVPGNSQNTEDISNMISPSPVTLIIEDTGIGIRKEDLPRIFEKGYTGVNGRENNRATGIGLYLSKKIMKRLGHRIYVTSEEGKGTKVFLEFSQNVLTMY